MPLPVKGGAYTDCRKKMCGSSVFLKPCKDWMLDDCGVVKTCGRITILLTVEHYICPVLLSGGDDGGKFTTMHTGIMVYHAGIIGFSKSSGSGPVNPVRGVLDFDGIGTNFI